METWTFLDPLVIWNINKFLELPQQDKWILHPNDEFIILGCDGIWDWLTNEQAVKYVRERIDTKTPVEIGIEMLDEIISEDPRSTQQGIGGDNMMIMVIDLQPQQWAYQWKLYN